MYFNHAFRKMFAGTHATQAQTPQALATWSKYFANAAPLTPRPHLK